MKFGLFFEIQVPKPWEADAERRAFQECIEQAVLADKLGYDVVWAAEHHFLEEYAHDSSPEILLAAIAAKTEKIRIGHGIKHLTTNSPLRVAEQAATLDIISNGRLELGLGEGSNTTELHPFSVRFRDKRDLWIDAVKATMPMFWNEAWSYESENFSIPERNVLPKPVQKPNPPLWVACSQIETIRQSARWGMGALGFSFVDPIGATAWVHAYYNDFINRPDRLENYTGNANIGCSYYFSCAETDELAMERGEGATFFEFALGHYQKNGPFEAGKTDFWPLYEEWRHTEKAKKKQADLGRTMLIGSPETLRTRLREIESTHIDHVLLIAQIGHSRHEDIMASIELFGREVMPEFQERDNLQQDWKQSVLDGSLVLEDIDTTGHGTLLSIDQRVGAASKSENTFADNIE